MPANIKFCLEDEVEDNEEQKPPSNVKGGGNTKKSSASAGDDDDIDLAISESFHDGLGEEKNKKEQKNEAAWRNKGRNRKGKQSSSSNKRGVKSGSPASGSVKKLHYCRPGTISLNRNQAIVVLARNNYLLRSYHLHTYVIDVQNARKVERPTF
jgi:hypothetical protein